MGGVARSFEEMADIDEAWWLQLSMAERLRLVAELSREADWSRHGDEEGGPAGEGMVIRLLGPLGGVRRL